MKRKQAIPASQEGAVNVYRVGVLNAQKRRLTMAQAWAELAQINKADAERRAQEQAQQAQAKAERQAKNKQRRAELLAKLDHYSAQLAGIVDILRATNCGDGDNATHLCADVADSICNDLSELAMLSIGK